MSIRAHVIEKAVLIESLVSQFLAGLLDINPDTSRTLGNRSGALSFRNKIDLLIEIDTIDRELANKFILFSEIRNQFAHNVEATNYTTCFSFMDKPFNKLTRWYPKFATTSEKSKEELYALHFEILYEDLTSSFRLFVDSLRGKYERDARAAAEKNYLDSLTEALEEVLDGDQELRHLKRNILLKSHEKFQNKKVVLNYRHLKKGKAT